MTAQASHTDGNLPCSCNMDNQNVKPNVDSLIFAIEINACDGNSYFTVLFGKTLNKVCSFAKLYDYCTTINLIQDGIKF